MRVFQGAGWGKMIAFTVVLHVVVIGGSSVPYLLRSFGGALSGERSREERIEKAVADATASLQKIAEANGVNPRELSERFGAAGGPPAAAPAPAPKPVEPPAAPAKSDDPPPPPKSAIEKELEKKTPGPALPNLDDDLFKE
jgi:uncharacterized membrane protein